MSLFVYTPEKRLVKRMRQRPADKRCVGFAAVYATGHTIEEFERWVSCPPPWRDDQAIAWLREHGYIAGWQAISFGSCGVRLEGELRIHMTIEHSPCLLCVRSRNHPKVTHMVYWDGHRVWDSDPSSPNQGEPLSAFAVVEIIPLSVRTKTPIPLAAMTMIQLDPSDYKEPVAGSFAQECSFGEGCPVCMHFENLEGNE